MAVSGPVCIVVRTIFGLVEFRPVLKDIGSIFSKSTVTGVSVTLREHFGYLGSRERGGTRDKNVGVESFTLVALFVTHTPVQGFAPDTGHDGDDSSVIEPMLDRVVNRNHPLAGLYQIKRITHKATPSIQKIQIYKNSERVILLPFGPPGLCPGGLEV